MKIVLEELLRRFDVAPETAPAERIARRAITFSPRDGGRVRVAPVTATAR